MTNTCTGKLLQDPSTGQDIASEHLFTLVEDKGRFKAAISLRSISTLVLSSIACTLMLTVLKLFVSAEVQGGERLPGGAVGSKIPN